MCCATFKVSKYVVQHLRLVNVLHILNVSKCVVQYQRLLNVLCNI